MALSDHLKEGVQVIAILPLQGGAFAIALADGRVLLEISGLTLPVEAHASGLLTAVATPEANAILTGGDDGRVMRIAGNGVITECYHEPRKWIDQIAAGPTGALAFAVGREAVVVRGSDPVRRFEHARAVNALAFAPKGYRLATAHSGGVSLWWAGRDAEPTMLNWDGAHIGVTFSPDGKYLMTAMQDNQLHGWRLSDNASLRMAGYPAKTRSWDWTAKGEWLATSGAPSAVLWPFKTKSGPIGQQPKQVGERAHLVTRVACHPKRQEVAIGFADGAVGLVALDSLEAVTVRFGDGSPVSALAFSLDGKLLAYGTESGVAEIKTNNTQLR